MPSVAVSTVLDSSVLVLNRYYQPVNITSVRRAFALLYQGAAHAVDNQFRTFDFESWAALGASGGDSDVVRTVSQAIRVPRVILLQIFDKLPRTRVRFSRQNIYLRDGSTCQYCARRLPRTELNLDHVVPRSQGGRTSWLNVVCSCVKCNLKKGGRTPLQAGMKLLKAPSRPKWTPFTRPLDGRAIYASWRPFLSAVDAAYWTAELIED